METIEIILAVVTLLGSGAAFKFYENVAKLETENSFLRREIDILKRH